MFRSPTNFEIAVITLGVVLPLAIMGIVVVSIILGSPHEPF